MVNDFKKILDRFKKYLSNIHWGVTNNKEAFKVNSKYIASSEVKKLNNFKMKYLKKQLTLIETLKVLKQKRISLIRYGDGEFVLMFDEKPICFQQYSPDIKKDLFVAYNESINSSHILVALPHFDKDEDLDKDLYMKAFWIKNEKNMTNLISKAEAYGNSYITRPEFFSLHHKKAVSLWRKVWKNEDLVIITGKNSRFNTIPELFDSAKSINYIYSEPVNAYESINMDEITNVINKQTSLVVIALGPMGTILSHKLAMLGYWALDIGHISNSYETVFTDGVWPEKLPTVVPSI